MIVFLFVLSAVLLIIAVEKHRTLTNPWPPLLRCSSCPYDFGIPYTFYYIEERSRGMWNREIWTEVEGTRTDSEANAWAIYDRIKRLHCGVVSYRSLPIT